MKSRYQLTALLSALALASASADTIELKDGTKLDGKVLSKEGDNYLIQVQVTKGIKEERSIPKASVARIVAEDKSESGFIEVAALVPVPDLATAAEYQARLTKAQNFLKSYKENKHRAELEKIVDTLGKESDVVSTGGVKFGGKLITAEERKPIAYTLDSKLAFANVKRLAEQGNVVASLRAWSSFEKDFYGSAVLRENLSYGVRLMQSQQALVSQMIVDQPNKVKQREEGLKNLSDQQRGTSKAAIEEEMAAYKKISETEKAQQVKWPTLNEYVKQPLEDTKRALDADIRRLQSLASNTSTMPQADEAFTKGWEAVRKDGATKQEIQNAISEARNKYVPQPYIDILAAASPIPLDNK